MHNILKVIHSKSIWLILLTSCLLYACVKEISLPNNEVRNAFVINGSIKANSQITVSVASIQNIYSTIENPFDSTLVVKLLKNDFEKDTLVFSGGKYKSPLIASHGDKLSIEIESADHPALKAETIIPSEVSHLNCEFTAGNIFNEYGEAITESFISFSDNGDEDNQYLFFLGDFDYDTVFHSQSYGQYWHLNDPILVNEGILDYSPSFFVFSDELFNGKDCTIKLMYYNGIMDKGEIYLPLENWCVFRKISKEYYLFLKSLLQHQYNQQIIDFTNFDPTLLLLKGQPTEVYTNIEGGHGILASYSEVIQEFKYVTGE